MWISAPALARSGGAGCTGSMPGMRPSRAETGDRGTCAEAAAGIPGLEALWAQTQGDARVRVALLDGSVDRSHPSLRGADLTYLEGLVSGAIDDGPACRHGTHVASLIFGQPGSSVTGVAPRCRGAVLPIFESLNAHASRACSQLDLARALTQAVLWGAQVISVSGGQFSASGTAHPLLAGVVRDCARRKVLLVAAVGNDGGECLHIPAALDSVLAVGAMDAQGQPLGLSNWGGPYQTQGILAPGQDVRGARPGGGTARASGSSYATALVSGVVALLLSLQLKRGQRPDPWLVREAILASALGCNERPLVDCRRLLAGRLNVLGAVSFLTAERPTMTEPTEVQASGLADNRLSPETAAPPRAAPARIPGLAERDGGSQAEPVAPAAPPLSTPARAETLARPNETPAASCSCRAAAAAPQLVYALGEIGYDFPSEARLDSIVQKLAAQARTGPPERGLAYDPRRLLAYLENNPWDAAAIEWTLSLDGTAVYAIRPQGPFAAEGYRELRRFLRERLEEGVERISIPGVIAGKATLLTGQVVPVIVPELRGMYSWTTAGLVEAVVGPAPAGDGPAPERDGHEQRRAGVQNFLQRVYYEARNLGLTPQDRALNFAATNAFAMGQIYAAAIQERMELDRIGVVPSPIGRPGSDCWDVEVYFFYPERQVQTVRKVYRFTVDVSDNVPVTVGAVRSWFTR